MEERMRLRKRMRRAILEGVFMSFLAWKPFVARPLIE